MGYLKLNMLSVLRLKRKDISDLTTLIVYT
nr:MAG TPA: hypothetical protein [Caudoviricetes sp.]